MKLFRLSAATILGVILITSSANADILCQRKKEKKPSSKSVLNLKIVKGTSCPAGFTKLGEYISTADVSSIVNQQVAGISSVSEPGPVGPQGPAGEKGEKGDKGDKGDTGLQGATGLTGAQGIQGEAGPKGATGEQGIQGPKGDTGEQGPQGVEGPQGEQGPKGLLSIDSCYSTTGSRTGTYDETETFFCNNPESEFVLHVGYSVDKDAAGPVRESLEFAKDGVSYSHPVGATVRAYNGALIGNTYTLSVTLLCCPTGNSNTEQLQ